MNKPNFETQMDVVSESELSSFTAASDLSRTLRPLQELTLREITAVSGGNGAPIFF